MAKTKITIGQFKCLHAHFYGASTLLQQFSTVASKND